ncbi:peptidoglycan recognition protein family protein [Cellulomonas taurus]|uniref:peptidoglycan recognition protein family protein n=1 Tax=Cellulomonas taurus TaxID=2729175 RepID=UPI00197E107B|nr:peptidoglycan-binding domain-containing protein [Cellulomonas taurus]
MATIASPNKYAGRASAVEVIVIHTMEAAETSRTAENIAAYFAKASTRASAHICADDDSLVRCVADEDTAWAAPGANANGLQIELAGYARQTAAEWSDEFSTAMLELTAQQCAEWVRKYGIPVKHLSVAELKAGHRGFVAHDDVSKAFKRSTHWDPGPNFPWTSFLARVSALAGATAQATNPIPAPVPTATIRQGSRGTLVTRVQTFLGVSADGVFGPATHAAVVTYQRALGFTGDGIVGPVTWEAINAGRHATAGPSPRSASVTRATQAAVRADQDGYWGDDTDWRVNIVRAAINGQRDATAQQVIGTTPDGVWGPKSVAALTATIAALQKAWGTDSDGVWGPKTEAAYATARANNYKTW